MPLVVGTDWRRAAARPGINGYVEFKDQPQWQQAYTDVKPVLSEREHMPTAEESAERRTQLAKKNRR